MAPLDANSPLHELCPQWTTDDRAIAWLFTFANNELDAKLRPCESANFEQLKKLVCHIRHHGFDRVEQQKSKDFINKSVFDWIDNKGRQPVWLLKKAEQIWPTVLPEVKLLEPKKWLIALIDYHGHNVSDHLNSVTRLKSEWAQQQVKDSQLSWYAGAGKEKQRCEIAWHWYYEKNPLSISHIPKFSKADDVFSYLDETNLRHDEKLYHLEQIKKRFKTEEVKASRHNKKQTNISLSDHARRQLDALASENRMTKTELIEHLILKAAENGLPK